MRTEEEEARLQAINFVLSNFKNEGSQNMVAGCSNHGFNSVTAKQYLQFCMFLMSKLFGVSVCFGDEDEKINNVIHVITRVLDCPVAKKIRRSDFKTPTGINSKSACIILLHWLSEEVTDVFQLRAEHSNYTLNQSTLLNLFSEQENDFNNNSVSEASGSNTSYEQFENPVHSTSTELIRLSNRVSVLEGNTPQAALFRKYFPDIDIVSEESFQMAMEIIDSAEMESRKKLGSGLKSNEKLNAELLQFSNRIEKEEAHMIELSIKIEQARLGQAEKELELKATWAQHDQLKLNKHGNKSHRRRRAVLIDPSLAVDEENSNAYLNVKLRTLVEKLEVQETHRAEILDKYMEEVPVLNTHISVLNEQFERVDVDCVPCWHPPLCLLKLHTWMKSVIANCSHCSGDIERKIDNFANKGKQRTALFSTDTDTSEERPKILAFNVNPNSESNSTEGDFSVNHLRILIRSVASNSSAELDNVNGGTKGGILPSACVTAFMFTLPFSSAESSLTDSNN